MKLETHIVWILLLFCTSSFCLHGQEEGVWNISLDSLVVKVHKNTSSLKTSEDGKIRWQLEQLSSLPMILGNADPLRYSQMLPGVQTNDEYSTGLHIQGCGNQHNAILAGRVPLYNINHLMGFFSSFIPSHYSSMELSKAPSSTQMPNRLGGELNMLLPDNPVKRVGGELSLGFISSHGTLRLPIADHTAATVSMRGSYMNLLYSRWLKEGDHQLGYTFGDVNMTVVHQVDSSNKLIVDGYLGRDKAVFSDHSYLADMRATWGNRMVAAHWLSNCRNGLAMNHVAYVTQYHNQFRLAMPGMTFNLPSSILDVGYNVHMARGKWKAGAEIILHRIKPQNLESSGTYIGTSSSQATAEKPVELSLYGDYTLPLVQDIKLTVGLRSNSLQHAGGAYYGVDPLIRIAYNHADMQLSAAWCLKHQYLFQTGFSDMGLPTEFWMSANRDMPPQTSSSLSVSYSHYLFSRRWMLVADAFYKKLGGQVEYFGSVLDLVNTAYDVNNLLQPGHGENYGFSIMLNKCSGRLTGWLSYGYTHADATFNHKGQGEETYPANHSRPHELNAVVSYRFNEHWDFGVTMTYATGTPYTAASSLSLLNGNILIQYGRHNGERLRPYGRIDVSVNYKWKNKVFSENGLNFSIYNLTGRNNEVFHYLSSHQDGQFAYRPVISVLRLLPSLNYYCKF